MKDTDNYSDQEIKLLLDELEHFKNEKEKVRQLIGQIGGLKQKKYDKFLNYFFIILIALLFIFDIIRHFLHLDIPLPDVFSLELGILLVSLKIIWMMHKQSKLEHFQFWILNSIEFKLNQISKRLGNLVKISKK